MWAGGRRRDAGAPAWSVRARTVSRGPHHHGTVCEYVEYVEYVEYGAYGAYDERIEHIKHGEYTGCIPAAAPEVAPFRRAGGRLLGRNAADRPARRGVRRTR
ncbi:cheW protein [Streptomyces laurentii]|uniref:CheW protein n=1 Tax=Streptomyces laurentii TaxID=39478 RepID=A0A161JHY9_STRLU|nr:cheW protein [Streptomyces laurentii]